MCGNNHFHFVRLRRKSEINIAKCCNEADKIRIYCVVEGIQFKPHQNGKQNATAGPLVLASIP